MRNWTRGLVTVVAVACALGMAYGCVSPARDASSDAVAESPEGMSDSSKVVEFEGSQEQAQSLSQGDLGSSYAGPTVPDEWLSYPGQFDSEDDRYRYEAGEWHTDADLRNRYSFATVRTSSGAEYVAGELVVVFPSHVTEDQVERQAASLGCVAAEIHAPSTNGDRRVRLVFPDNADMEAVAEDVSAQLGLDASLDTVFRVM